MESSHYHESMGQRRDQASVSLCFSPAQSTLTFQLAFSTHLSPLKTITETHVNKTLDRLGTIPHLCVNSSSYELTEYKSAMNKVVENIMVDEIQQLIKYFWTLYGYSLT